MHGGDGLEKVEDSLDEHVDFKVTRLANSQPMPYLSHRSSQLLIIRLNPKTLGTCKGARRQRLHTPRRQRLHTPIRQRLLTQRRQLLLTLIRQRLLTRMPISSHAS